MRLSLAYEMQRPVVDDHAVVEETIEQCVLADKMGFDAVWFVEHHFLTSFSMSPCPEVMFGALSRLTKRIRLGFGATVPHGHRDDAPRQGDVIHRDVRPTRHS